MKKKSFWKKEKTVTNQSLVVLLVVLFLISGVTTGLFTNFVFPWIASSSGLGFLLPRFPIVVNKTEEIRINEGIKVNEVLDRINRNTVAILSHKSPLDSISNNLKGVVTGRGIIATSDGVIMTTKSAVGDLQQNFLTVITYDGEIYKAEVMASDLQSGLTAIKIEAENLSVANFKNSKDLLIGDKLVAVLPGLPLIETSAVATDLTQTPATSNGFIQTQFTDDTREYLEVSPALPENIVSVILASRDSYIVGLRTSTGILTGEFVRNSLQNLLDNEDFLRPRLGLRYINITPTVADLFGLKLKEYGALVVSEPGKPAVIFGGAAYEAGLREDDFIYKINETELDRDNTLKRLLSDIFIGQETQVEFLRKEEVKTVKMLVK